MKNAPLIALLLSTTLAIARIGETESECNKRYGTPLTDKTTLAFNEKSPLVPTCPTKTYNYHGFRIRIAFLGFGGPAIKMHFQKTAGNSFFKNDETAAILQANLPDGMKWNKRVPGSPPQGNPLEMLSNTIVQGTMGARAWERSDKVTAQLEMMKTGIIIECPTATTIEKRTAEEKEKERKTNIPKF